VGKSFTPSLVLAASYSGLVGTLKLGCAATILEESQLELLDAVVTLHPEMRWFQPTDQTYLDI
jgi:hypothetical protein